MIPYTFGEDPDDAYSSIPYEKGSNFLLYLGEPCSARLVVWTNVDGLERKVGGLDVFMPYIKDYVNTFRGKSIRTDQWKAHLFQYFEANGGKAKLDILNGVDWDVGDIIAERFTKVTVNIGLVAWRGDGVAGSHPVRYVAGTEGLRPGSKVGRITQTSEPFRCRIPSIRLGRIQLEPDRLVRRYPTQRLALIRQNLSRFP